MEPFEIAISDEVLEDLRRRLQHARWPDEMPGTGWEYGSNLDYVKELVEYWRTDFDWRAQEKKLNAFNHFKTDVDGLSIHFIKENGTGPNPMPLVITHGWPSTFFEMTKIIPLLADPGSHGGDPADSFDVVAPSLPGFGFSQASQEPGMQVQKVADLWAKMMTENLGYPKFAAQGGDIGAGVTSRLGYAHSDKMIGVHLTSITRPTPYLGPGSRPLTDAEQAHSGPARALVQPSEGGYNHLQGTKPQTLSYGLNDSPAGRSGGLDRREVAHLERLQRRRGEHVHERRVADHGDHLLGDADHRLVGADVQGEPEFSVGDGAGRKGADAGWDGDVPAGDRQAATGMGRAVLGCPPVDADAPGRPLCRAGGTGVAGPRGAGVLQTIPQLAGRVSPSQRTGANNHSPLFSLRRSAVQELQYLGVDLFGSFLVHEVAGAGDDDLLQAAGEVGIHP